MGSLDRNTKILFDFLNQYFNLRINISKTLKSSLPNSERNDSSFTEGDENTVSAVGH